MKLYCLIINLFFSISLYSQYQYSSTYLDFYIKNNDVVFKKEYAFKTANIDSNYNQLISVTNNKKHFSPSSVTKNTISGYLKNDRVDYRKYCGSWAWTSSYLHYPLYAYVNIEIKDSQYIVTVSGIFFYHLPKHKFFDIATTKNHMKFKEGKTATESLKYLDSYLTDLFILQ